MKKLFTPKLLPFLPGLLGISVTACRLWLLSAGLDEGRLFARNHIADTLSYLLLAVTAVVVYLSARPLLGSGKQYPFQPSATGGLGSLLGGLGVLSSALLEPAVPGDLIHGVCLVLGIAACIALFVTGFCRILGRPVHYLFSGIVTLFFLAQLISRYRLWSSEPQPQEYVFPLLASSFLLIASGQHTCLDAGFGNRRIYMFANQMALFCCMASVGTRYQLFYAVMAIWCLTDLCDTRVPEMKLPANVLLCMDKLADAGYQSYAVGGCVRDCLLGLEPHDYDLCTDATPEQTAQVFRDHQLIRNGEKHGTVGVVLDGQVYEITTFRTEGAYSDSRHPDSVTFVKTLRKDLARRDFTVNAMAYCPEQGFIDPFGGSDDLVYGVLKTVGNPRARFREDALRILRGVRFALRFRLNPEDQTLKAMKKLAPTLDQLAGERVFRELCGILPLVTAEDLKKYKNVFIQVIPELKPCWKFRQHSRHHAYDVYTHTAHVTETVPPDPVLRLAALLHDVGKPSVFHKDKAGHGHFPEHAKAGARMADEILRRLKAPNALREQVVFLIAHHMIPLQPDRQLLRRRLSKYGVENCLLLLQLQKADFNSKGVKTAKEDIPDFEAMEKMLRQILEEQPCLQTKDLAVNGHDLMALGFTPGPSLGKALDTLLALVVDEVLPNEKEALLAKAKEMMEDTQ